MKTKLLALFLCLAMLLTMVAMFASCGGEEDPTPEDPDNPPAEPEANPIEVSKNEVKVDMYGFKIVRPESGSYTNVLKQDATELSAAITDATNVTVRISDDNGNTSSDDLEILLGFGPRDVAGQAFSEINGDGWIIRTFADQGKIVIGGTTEFLTSVAIDYFVKNCLGKASGSEVTVSDKIVCQNMEMVEVVGYSEEEGKYEGKYSIVYRSGLDDKAGSIYGSEPHTSNYDKPYEVASAIKSLLVSTTRVGQYTIPYSYDTDEPKDTGKGEILVGVLDRPESKAENAKLNANQYSLVIRNGKIILGALNDTMLVYSQALFNNMIEQSVCLADDGSKYIRVPANYSCTETYSDGSRDKFVLDFPQPDGVILQETVDVGTNSMLYIYAGDAVSRDGYLAYCDKLESEGYEVVSEEYVLEGSSFRTYLNRDEKITLHVSHEAHTHATEQSVVGYQNSLRVVAASTEHIDFDEDLFDPNKSWVKITDTMITNYELNRSVGVWGNSMIMTLEDGSFIVFDGGYNGDNNTGKDEDYLYQVLLDLYKKTHNGAEPTRNDPIRISWFLSHEHGDHFGVFRLFIKKYGPDSTIRIDRVMCNFISAEERVNTYNPETRVQTDIENLKSYGDDFDFIKVHTGETYYIANAAIRIMYTHEDAYPVRLGFFNNSSTVFYVNFHSTNAAKNTASDFSKSADVQTLVLLGDLERVGSRCLRSMFGAALQADMVQVAHHGYNGCEEALYKLINPEVVWFPASNGEVMRDAQSAYSSSSNWINAANYGVCREIERVRLIVSGGDTNTNLLGYNFTLTLNTDGIDYVNFYDAINHKQVVTESDIPQPGQGDCYVVLRPAN